MLETGLVDVDAFTDSCLAFCRSLRRHHVGEDQAAFGIAAVLENHLDYEERVLVSVLDRMDVVPGSADDGALRAPLRGVLEPEWT